MAERRKSSNLKLFMLKLEFTKVLLVDSASTTRDYIKVLPLKILQGFAGQPSLVRL